MNQQKPNRATLPESANDIIESKVVLLGDSGVGKTSIVLRYVHQQFSSTLNPTIGASFLTKTLWIGSSRIKLQLWDTAGQERFRSLAPMYYRGAAVGVLIFDVCSLESYNRAKEWEKEVRANNPEEMKMVLVGNQIDKQPRMVTTEEAKAYAELIEAKYFETSAKANIGIDEMFLEIAKQLLSEQAPQQTQEYDSIKLGQSVPKKQEKRSCPC